MKKLMPLKCIWMVEVLILRTLCVYVMKLVIVKMTMEGKGML